MDLEAYIRTIPDWPEEGIQFKDICPLVQNPKAFKEACDRVAEHYKGKGIDKVAAIEARGYVFGSVIAYLLDAGFTLIRKPGKLPHEIISEDYQLEYGMGTLEMHKDAVDKGDTVLIFDDLLATGGTAKAAINLIEKAGANVIGVAFVIELTGTLRGRDELEGYDIMALMDIPVSE